MLRFRGRQTSFHPNRKGRAGPESDRDQGVRPGSGLRALQAILPGFRFYKDFGFEVAWSSDDLAYLKHGETSFLLQKFYVEKHAGNFMMHLLVEDVEAWWHRVQDLDIVARYGVRSEPPSDKPWRLRDFVLVDPTGVLWRVGQTI